MNSHLTFTEMILTLCMRYRLEQSVIQKRHSVRIQEPGFKPVEETIGTD